MATSEVLKELYSKLEKAAGVEERIDLLNRLAFELMNNNDSRFERHSEEAQRLSEIAGYTKGKIDAHLNLGRLAFRKSNYAECIKQSEKAYQLAEQAGDIYLKAIALDNLSPAYLMSDKPQRALDAALKAVELFGKRDDPKRARAMSLNNAGNASNVMGDHETALKYYSEGLKLLEGTEHYSQQLSIEGNIAACLMHLKEYQEAFNLLEQLHKKFVAIPHFSGAISALDFMAQCQEALKQYSKAIDYYTQALKLLNRYENKSLEVNILLGLGNVFIEISGHKEALKHYEKALAISRSIHFQKGETNALLALARYHSQKRDRQLALTLCEQAEALAKTLQYKNELASLQQLKQELTA